MRRNYLLALTRLLKRRKWHSDILWKMIEQIIKDLTQRDDNALSYKVFKDIYDYALKCKTMTELEDLIDTFTY